MLEWQRLLFPQRTRIAPSHCRCPFSGLSHWREIKFNRVFTFVTCSGAVEFMVANHIWREVKHNNVVTSYQNSISFINFWQWYFESLVSWSFFLIKGYNEITPRNRKLLREGGMQWYNKRGLFAENFNIMFDRSKQRPAYLPMWLH